MSLINDMLRDLAAKQQSADIATVDHEQLLAESGITRKQKSVWLPSLLIFFLVLTVVLVIQTQFGGKAAQQNASSLAGVEDMQGNATSANIVDESAAVVVPVSEANSDISFAAAPQNPLLDEPLPSAPESLAKELLTKESLAEKSSTDELTAHTDSLPQSTAQQMVINAWLKLADNALAQDRLASPLEDSAFYYYQEILRMAPEHPQALQGLDDIAERYLQLVLGAIQQQQFNRAQTLLRRAGLVAPEHAGIAAMVAELAQAEFAAEQNNIADVQPSPQRISAAVPVVTQTESYSLPAHPSINAAQMHLSPNRDWQDQQAAEQAREFMQQGKTQLARLHLETFVQHNVTASLSSQLLCQLYIEQGDLADAETLFADTNALSWPVNDRQRLRAQWLVAKGESKAAQKLLEDNLPNAEMDERYRALLASLYHTNSNYHEAVASYRRLLSTFGEKSSYWLGLALALDALTQKNSALEAYRRAQNFQPLQAEVNTYIEQRIAALAR